MFNILINSEKFKNMENTCDHEENYDFYGLKSANCELSRASNEYTVAFFHFEKLQYISGNFRVHGNTVL